MKNIKKLLFAGLILGTAFQTVFPMEQPENKAKEEVKKSYWEWLAEMSPIQIQRESTIKTVHPDVKAFLLREMAKKSSLSGEDLANVTFELLPKDNDIRNMKASTSYLIPVNPWKIRTKPYMYVPDLEEFFNIEIKDGNTALVEIPDSELSEYLRKKKTLLRYILKHEEGHLYYKHGNLSYKIPCFVLLVIASAALGLHPVVPAASYMIIASQISKYYESQADNYAINHINDPLVLRESANWFMCRNAGEGNVIKALDFAFGSHPSYAFRAKLFLEAAEKLEKETKDRM